MIAAFDLEEAPREDWLVGDGSVSAAVVREAHLDWYREHPDAVAEGVRRHGDVLRLLAGG